MFACGMVSLSRDGSNVSVKFSFPLIKYAKINNKFWLCSPYLLLSLSPSLRAQVDQNLVDLCPITYLSYLSRVKSYFKEGKTVNFTYRHVKSSSFLSRVKIRCCFIGTSFTCTNTYRTHIIIIRLYFCISSIAAHWLDCIV